MSVAPISLPVAITALQGSAPAAGSSTGFSDVLKSAVQQVEASGRAADAAAQNFVNGGNQELHSTVLASQSADLDFEMFLQVRNKVVNAYEEVMRMQL
jgi:flagellar hook-basal body complex protein FliE